MKYLAFLLTFLSLGLAGLTQTTPPAASKDLNLGFEHLVDSKLIGWYTPDVGGYTIQVDSLVKHSGKNSIRLSFSGGSATFTAASLKLPAIYKGDSITLSGYIKTENVTDGRAGLWLRIDPRVAFDNMDKTEVAGTTDWKKYEIRLKMDPENSKAIIIGGLLIGKGTMWLDDLEVKIDGKPLSQALIFSGREYPADKDTAFNEASGITHFSTDRQTLENLKVLGLVWGYLKFYHPNVGRGNYNWDNELFRLLPRVASAKSNDARDAFLSDYIAGLGAIQRGDNLSDNDSSMKLAVDTSWFSSAALSDKLVKQLKDIYIAKRSGADYYYDFSGADNVSFHHDKMLPFVKTNDAGARLLALYRYWNAIEYFYPYRYLISNWQKVLVDYIPIMIGADTRLKYEQGLTSLIGRIRDTHGSLYGSTVATGQFYGKYSPAIGLAYIQKKWVVDRYLDSAKGLRSGVEIGDEVTFIDGKPVSQIVASRLAITPASNQAAQYRNLSWLLLRTHADSMNIDLKRNGRQLKKTVQTYEVKGFQTIRFADTTKTPFKKLSTEVGYLYPGTIKNNEVDEIMKKAADTKGLIIDFRCYPSDFLVFTLGVKLTDKPVAFVKFSSIDHDFPGKIVMGTTMSLGKDNSGAYKGKVVVLVNEYTQSSAEYTTMAFRATGAKVIGSTTAGADGNVSTVLFPGNLNTWFSGLGVYYPDGTETQRVGIVPDIYSTPTVKGIKEGRDEVLERAIEYIQTGK